MPTSLDAIHGRGTRRAPQERIAIAVEKKAGKLAAAKRQFAPAESILVLESNDFALANHAVIGDAVRAALAAHAELPDHIYLVETNRGCCPGASGY